MRCGHLPNFKWVSPYVNLGCTETRLQEFYCFSLNMGVFLCNNRDVGLWFWGVLSAYTGRRGSLQVSFACWFWRCSTSAFCIMFLANQCRHRCILLVWWKTNPEIGRSVWDILRTFVLNSARPWIVLPWLHQKHVITLHPHSNPLNYTAMIAICLGKKIVSW